MTDSRKVVYLDQNKWIDLARAQHGGADGARFRPTFEFLNDSVTRTRVVLPLSAIHYIETARIGGKSKSRVLLGKTMWELSDGHTMHPTALFWITSWMQRSRDASP